MDLPRVADKLEEALFFCAQLRQEENKTTLEGRKDVCRYYLSAFLNACYSAQDYQKKDVDKMLNARVTAKGQSKKRGALTYQGWLAQWKTRLPLKDLALWEHMGTLRTTEVHFERVKTIKESKAVPADQGSRLSGAQYYNWANTPLVLAGDEFGDGLQEERQKLGLPSFCTAWTYAYIDHLKIAGEQVRVVEACEKYLQLLNMLVQDCHE